jgi:hypothetical protein
LLTRIYGGRIKEQFWKEIEDLKGKKTTKIG